MKTQAQRALICLLLAMMLIPLLPAFAQGVPPGVPGFSLLGLEMTDAVITLAARGDTLAVLSASAHTDERALTLYQLPGMAQKARTAYDKPAQSDGYEDIHLGILPDGRVFAANLTDAQVDLYDPALNVLVSRRFLDTNYPIAAFMQPDGQALYIGTGENELLKLDMQTGALKPLHPQVPAGFLFYTVLGMAEGRLRLHYYKPPDLDLVVELAENGATALIPVMRGHSYLDAQHVMLSDSQTALFGQLGQEAYVQIDGWQAGEHLLAVSGSSLLSSRFEDSDLILRLYDTSSLRLMNQLVIPHEIETLSLATTLLAGENQVLSLYQGYEPVRTQLYLWDAQASAQPEEAGMRRVTYPDLMAEHDQMARDIKARHGVTVHIRQAGASFRNDVYHALSASGELPLRHALIHLRAFLDQLPAGMIKEALLMPYTDFAIYLCGPIMQKSSEGISYPAGFSTEEGSLRYLALDVQDSAFLSTLHHEFMHLLEDRLSQTAYEVDKPVFMFWDNLGPKEAEHHGFALTYTDASGDTFFNLDYTALHEDAQAHPDRVWFVDAYSRTWPLEDRARLFEHMMTTSPSADPFIFPHLRKKAQILAALLRQSFPSLQAVATAPWESQIEQAADVEAFLGSVYDELTAP